MAEPGDLSQNSNGNGNSSDDLIAKESLIKIDFEKLSKFYNESRIQKS